MRRSNASVSQGIAIAVTITACTTAPVPPSPSTATIPADETRDALSDVLTVLFNSRMAERQGRTIENEVSGAHDAREWNAAQREAGTACEAAGAELFINSWTGG